MIYKNIDWRYRDALRYIEDRSHIPKDRLTRRLAAHIKYIQGKDPYKSALAKRNNFWVSRAYQLYCDLGSGSLKWLVEALALGGMVMEEISEHTGLEPELVDTYLDCFFDARDNDIKRRYINSMGAYTCSYDHSKLAHVGWKYMAVHFGLEFFKKYIYQRCEIPDDAMRKLRLESRHNRSVRSWSKSWESQSPDAVYGRSEVEELSILVKEELAEKDMARKAESDKRKSPTGTDGDLIKEIFPYLRAGMANQEVSLGAREERLLKT